MHDGPVRDGAPGRTKRAVVKRCGGCGTDRLAESACLETANYYTEAYLGHIGQGYDKARQSAAHDELARFTLDAIWPLSLRGLTVADVGCGNGSFLDHIRGLPDRIIAIEPAEGFAGWLIERGYEWFPTAADAGAEVKAEVDVAFAIQVIEHVEDPVAFLRDVGALSKPGGLCVVSTPNRADILMDLLPDDFPSHFYRTQHRWAFDAASLRSCVEAAGLTVQSVRHVHRYGMANSLLWLRERNPAGRAPLPMIDATADAFWKSWLEANGRADNLYAFARRPEQG